jgi:ketosteroid isomerase-like protein
LVSAAFSDDMAAPTDEDHDVSERSIVTDDDVVELVQLMDVAADAYIRGAIDEYVSLFDHGDDYTLMSPFGGPTVRGFTHTPEWAEQIGRFFVDGEGHFELEQSYRSGDLVVLAGVERQHGSAGGLPDQDLSLRVSLVFRRAGERWELVHRHADALVREIPFEHVAQLARGLGN